MGFPIRYTIILMVFFTTYINYTTRANFSISLTAMAQPKKGFVPECKKGEEKKNKSSTTEDLGKRFEWGEDIQGRLIGAYFVGYIVGSLPAGPITEWFGPFHTLFWTTLATGIFNFLCVPFANIHWIALYAARCLMGVCAGTTYPALQCLIGRWAPPQERGLFVSGLMGNTIGTCLTWILVGMITSAFKWPMGFYFLSIQIMVYLVIIFFFLYDSPDKHKWISEEELDFIKTSQEGKVSGKKSVPPMKKILTSWPFWVLAVLHFGNLWGLNLQITAIPKFMAEYVGFNIKSSGVLSSLPHLLRFFLGIGYGSLGDFLKKKKYKRVYILKSFIMLSHIVPGILIGSVGLVECNSTIAVILLILSMSINGAAVMTNLSNPTDLSPNFAGTIFGIISFTGGTTGFVVPPITGTIIEKFGNNTKAWTLVFALGGCVYCGCGIFFMVFGSADVQPWNEKQPEPEAEEPAG